MKTKKIKDIEEMVKQRIELKNNISEIESKIYKIENEYLELTTGCNLMRNLEFYIHTKPEKKRQTVEEEDRVFATNFPSQKE